MTTRYWPHAFRSLLLGIALGVSSMSARASVLSLQWDPSPDGTVNRYRIYSSPSLSSSFSAALTTSGTQASLTNGTSFAGYRFYVTALTDQGLESDPSNVIEVTAVSGPTLNFTAGSGRRLTLAWSGIGVVQSAPTVFGPWTDRYSSSPVQIQINATGPPQFYRLKQ